MVVLTLKQHRFCFGTSDSPIKVPYVIVWLTAPALADFLGTLLSLKDFRHVVRHALAEPNRQENYKLLLPKPKF